MTERDIRPYGDSAVILSIEQNISASVLQEVSAAADAVRRASLPGVLDIIPAYCTVTVLFDPWVTDCGKLIREINSLDLSPDLSGLGSVRHVSIPVLYGSPFPEDLAHVAEHSGLSVEDVIRLHTANEYPVYMIGFLPGFPYLGNLDPRLNTPRRTSPRELIPAGSVGIGGAQTGIYPVDSPGGWHIIGKTPAKLYDPAADEPLLLKCGDIVRFVSVTEEEFRRIESSGGVICT